MKVQSLTTITFKLVVSTLCLVTIAISYLAYHFSASAVNNEIEKSQLQTTLLFQNTVQFKLSSLSTVHEIQSTNPQLASLINSNDLLGLDELFFQLEQKIPYNTPDFRFITQNNELVWEDGNSQFYGIEKAMIADIIDCGCIDNYWSYNEIAGQLGIKNLILRKTPIIDRGNGRVVAYLHIAIVLNNNLPLMSEFKQSTGVDAVMLIINNQIISSSEPIDSPVHAIIRTIKQSELRTSRIGSHLINVFSEYDILASTPMHLVSLKANRNIEFLRLDLLKSIIISIICACLLGLLAKKVITSKVLNSLGVLMNYTESAKDNTNNFHPYPGSSITEFNIIGDTLQSTLSAIIEKERSLDDLFKISASPMVVWDCDFSISRINESACQHFQYQEEQSHDHATFIEFKKQITPYLNIAIKGTRVENVHTSLLGTTYLWSFAPLSISGKVIAIIGLAQDVTALFNAERQSRLAQIQAEASEKAKSDFLARMSHEIRTPLNGIMGLSQSIRDNLSHSDDLEKVDMLFQSGEHLLTVLNDILDFSQIEQGKLKLLFKKIQITETINYVQHVYQPLCKNKNLDLIVKLDIDQGAYCITDRARLIQVLFNLMSNAVKFTHQGSITLSVIQKEDILEFSVTDTGIGIDKSNLETLYQPFTQAEAYTTREYDGNGLGLSIVKNLVQLLDGKINVESTVSVGSCFTVRIPKTHSAAFPDELKMNKSIPLPTINPITEQLNVLIVEDNKTNAYVAKAFCQKFNFNTTWVDNGYDALKSVQQNDYDLILMDNHMPKLSGIDTTKQMRDNLGIKTPIYACTADAFNEIKDEFLTAGANYVITKPIREKNFLQALQFYAAEKRLKSSITH
ncbi:LuxQ periplasmic sensor domain-containing protein [Thaumasiovibrio sp. DFM-14]|uniref:LuxQ periplasmic sensor domain-containing protein n=1 Tax=Thaumasiovibrio sp. DFM-14 TaxID=3384792 RepID=UPI0039A28E95